VVLFRHGQPPLRRSITLRLFGDGMLERIRSASLAMLGVGTAVVLSLMVFAMQQGWPLAPNVPILQGPFGGGKIGDAQVVVVSPEAGAPQPGGATYTKGPTAPGSQATPGDNDRRAQGGSGLDRTQAVVVSGPSPVSSDGGGPAGGGSPGGGSPDSDVQPDTTPQPAANPAPSEGVPNGNGRPPVRAGVSNPSSEGGGQGSSRIRGPERSSHERETPPSWANDERSSHEREEGSTEAGPPEGSDRGESRSGRSEHERE
jgi:hypothetical protein